MEEHTEIADFFEQMARLPLEKVTPMVPLGGAGIGMHVIPVEKAIPANQQSASVEHISHCSINMINIPLAHVPADGNSESVGREPET